MLLEMTAREAPDFKGMTSSHRVEVEDEIGSPCDCGSCSAQCVAERFLPVGDDLVRVHDACGRSARATDVLQDTRPRIERFPGLPGGRGGQRDLNHVADLRRGC